MGPAKPHIKCQPLRESNELSATFAERKATMAIFRTFGTKPSLDPGQGVRFGINVRFFTVD